MDCRLPGSSIHGIFQARVLAWIAIKIVSENYFGTNQWIWQSSGYKINTQKSLAFLYTNNEKSGREIKESIPFIIATKIIKYLGINLPKETKELYTENYMSLMREIKDDLNRWREIPCSWIGRVNIVQMTTTKSNLQIQCYLHQITNGIFHRKRTKTF